MDNGDATLAEIKRQRKLLDKERKAVAKAKARAGGGFGAPPPQAALGGGGGGGGGGKGKGGKRKGGGKGGGNDGDLSDRTPEGKSICHAYAQSNNCQRGKDCKFEHVCQVCFGRHPNSQCRG